MPPLVALIQTPAPAVASAIERPAWLQRPSPDQILSVYPAAATARNASGRAVIDCRVNADTTLRDCTVKSETPEGLGFGAAALALSPQMRMRPQTVDGRATDDGRVTVPIAFRPGRPVEAAGVRNFLVRAPWRAAPSPEQVRAAYPRAALAAGRAGIGMVRCAVDGQGVLRNCRAPRRDDADGFDTAALALAGRFRVASKAEGASTSEATVDVTVAFTPEDRGAPPLDARPVWLRTPTADEALAALPQAAREAGVTRLTVVEHCTVAADGALAGCAVAREEPQVAGGAEAAAKLLPAFRMSVWSATGRPTAGSSLNLPIVWDVPALKAAAAPTP